MKRFPGKNKEIMTGLILLGVFLILALLVPMLSPYGTTTQDVSMQNSGAAFSHPFGTDKFGRDIFTRVWYGARISLLVGIISALLNSLIGIMYGGISGYAGRKTDMLLMRAADIVDAVPSLLYVILIMLVLGANVKSVIIGICISGWTRMARIVRGEVLRLKKMDFTMAAKLSGAGGFRILWKHLLPNIAGPVIVNLTFLVPEAIFTEAFLSFVGVGIAAPQASLGTLIQEAKNQMQVYPGQMLYPMLALCLIILSLNLIGTGLEKRMTERT